jgi:hypothetical protein
METKSVKERFDIIKDGLDEIFRELNLIFSKLASKEIDVREARRMQKEAESKRKILEAEVKQLKKYVKNNANQSK